MRDELGIAVSFATLSMHEDGQQPKDPNCARDGNYKAKHRLARDAPPAHTAAIQPTLAAERHGSVGDESAEYTANNQRPKKRMSFGGGQLHSCLTLFRGGALQVVAHRERITQ